MLLKMIEKILIKFLFKIQEKLGEKSEKSDENRKKIEKNRVSTPMDFGVYGGWKPSAETLREYEIRKGININITTPYIIDIKGQKLLSFNKGRTLHHQTRTEADIIK